jgi:hypothetical protein
MQMRERFTTVDTGLSVTADLARTDAGALNNNDFDTMTNSRYRRQLGGFYEHSC